MLIIFSAKVQNGKRKVIRALSHFAREKREKRYGILLSLLREGTVGVRENTVFLVNELLGSVEDAQDVVVRMEKRKEFLLLGLLDVFASLKGFFSLCFGAFQNMILNLSFGTKMEFVLEKMLQRLFLVILRDSKKKWQMIERKWTKSYWRKAKK